MFFTTALMGGIFGLAKAFSLIRGCCNGIPQRSIGNRALGWRAGIYGGWLVGGHTGGALWRNTLYMAELSLLKMRSTLVAHCALF
jgi:hypothetical protein